MHTLPHAIFPDERCHEHGIIDTLPCPWPECRNGVEEDQFQVLSLMEGEPPDIFTRRRWLATSGIPYFSWDNNRFPNWFSAPNTFWSEARRNHLARTKTPDLIYHYTSLDGFVGIVESGTIWLSDYAYLNDTRELAHGAELVLDVIDEIRKTETAEGVLGLLQTWEKGIQQNTHRICIASFSADGDSLGQWRSYGPVALGFEPRNLSLHAYRAHLGPVEYDRERQRTLVSTYLNHLCQAYVVDMEGSRLDRISDVYHKVDRLLELIAFFKDPAFQVENEYRLAYIEYPGLIEAFEIAPTPKHFRTTHTRLLPYAAANELAPTLSNQPPLKLSKVILGPDSDLLLERGIREFLATKQLSDVEVKRSIVPYRT